MYPKGGWRPADGVQRGSVADLPIYSGDPLTPGVGATKNAKRLKISEAKAILKIPVIPISYGDAQPLLAALSGPVAPPAWRGALPITYHVGPGPAKVHLEVTSDWGQKTLYDVIARIPGVAKSPINGSCVAIIATAGYSGHGIRCPVMLTCWPRPRRSVPC